MDIWKSEQAKEVFLCIAEGPKTQQQIIRQTGYHQGRVSEILGKLKTEALIVRLDEKVRTARRPQTKWDINPEIVFEKMVVKKGYTSGEFDYLVKKFKELPNQVRSYLKTVARHPLWRKDHCGNKEISDWDEYKKTRKAEFNLYTIGDYFTLYLMRNERKLTEKLKRKQMAKLESEVNEFARWILLSGDQLMVHFMEDKDL